MVPKIPIAVGTLAAAPYHKLANLPIVPRGLLLARPRFVLTRPWRPLNRLKAISLGKKGLMAVATATQAEPHMKILRLPKMSPILPQNKRKHPNVRVYDEMIHWTLAEGISRSLPMVGKMMTTAWIPRVYNWMSVPPQTVTGFRSGEHAGRFGDNSRS